MAEVVITRFEEGEVSVHITGGRTVVTLAKYYEVPYDSSGDAVEQLGEALKLAFQAQKAHARRLSEATQ